MICCKGSVTRMPQAGSESSFEGRRILVVDDDELVRLGTAGLIEAWGAQVEMAGNLDEVRRGFGQERFDLVICDYRLPDGNGMELADDLYARQAQKPAFILVSGDTSPEVLKQVADKGLHLLHKPVRPAKLRSMISFLLKGK